MDPIIIMHALTKAQQAAEYFNLIDSMSADVSKLLHQSFESANANLRYVATASADNVEHYIRQALNEFIRACAVEKDINLINAYLGTAVCQFMLGDIDNAKLSFNKIENIEPSRTLISKNVGKKIIYTLLYPTIFPIIFAKNSSTNRELTKFYEFKKAVLSIPQKLEKRYGIDQHINKCLQNNDI